MARRQSLTFDEHPGQELQSTRPVTPPKPAAKKQGPKRGAATTRVGVYLLPGAYDDAKSAFIADWRNERIIDNFPGWIENAAIRYAERTPQERAELARPTGQGKGRGMGYALRVTDRTLEAVAAGMLADQKVDRFPTRSSWLGDALTAATAASKERNGGTLPPAPDLLPRQLP